MWVTSGIRTYKKMSSWILVFSSVWQEISYSVCFQLKYSLGIFPFSFLEVEYLLSFDSFIQVDNIS